MILFTFSVSFFCTAAAVAAGKLHTAVLPSAFNIIIMPCASCCFIIIKYH